MKTLEQLKAKEKHLRKQRSKLKQWREGTMPSARRAVIEKLNKGIRRIKEEMKDAR